MASGKTHQFVAVLVAQATGPGSAASARHMLQLLEHQANECIARGADLRATADALGIRTEADAEAYADGMAEEIDLLAQIHEAMSGLRMRLPGLEARERRQRDVVLEVVRHMRSRSDGPVRYHPYLAPGLR